jgi:hypothetical protein
MAHPRMGGAMIRGEKVRFRAIERGDLPQLRDWRNHPEIRRRTREFRLLSMENQERWFAHLHEDKSTIMFAVLDEQAKLIGVVGLTYIDWKNRRSEVSIYVGEEGAQGRGYGLDALRTLVRYGFHTANLHKLYAEIFSFNEASVRLFEKAGFKRDGTKREDQYVDGRYWDTYVYSILATEAREPR